MSHFHYRTSGKEWIWKTTSFLRYNAEVNVKYKATLSWKDIQENSMDYTEMLLKFFVMSETKKKLW